MDGREMALSQGSTLVMLPGVRHPFTGMGPALILEISMPSVVRDNNFADERIQKSLQAVLQAIG